MDFLNCQEHRYSNCFVPQFNIKNGQLVLLESPIIGKDNEKFLLNNNKITLHSSMKFVTAETIRSNYSNVSKVFKTKNNKDAILNRIKNFGINVDFKLNKLTVYEKLIINLEYAFCDTSLVIIYTAGLSIFSLNKLNIYIGELIKENKGKRSCMFIKNSTIRKKINNFYTNIILDFN